MRRVRIGIIVILLVASIGTIAYFAFAPRPFGVPSTSLEIERLQRIAIGASSADVVMSLGEPLVKAEPGKTVVVGNIWPSKEAERAAEREGLHVWSYEDQGLNRTLLVYFREGKVMRLSLRQESPFKIIWSRP